MYDLIENRDLKEPAEIEQALRFGEYIRNGKHIDVHIQLQDPHSHRRRMLSKYRDASFVLSSQVPSSEAALRLT